MCQNMLDISSITALQAAHYNYIQFNGSVLIVISIIFRHELTRNAFLYSIKNVGKIKDVKNVFSLNKKRKKSC